MIVDAIAIYVGAGLLAYHIWGLVGAGAALLVLGLISIIAGVALKPQPNRPPR